VVGERRQLLLSLLINTFQSGCKITVVKTATLLPFLADQRLWYTLTLPMLCRSNSHWSRFSPFACDTLPTRAMVHTPISAASCKVQERRHKEMQERLVPTLLAGASREKRKHTVSGALCDGRGKGFVDEWIAQGYITTQAGPDLDQHA
jgi:hypothetical protein